MKIILEKDIREEEKIKNAILANDKNLQVFVNINENDLKISVKDNKKNLFGNLIKLDIYNIEINYCTNYFDKEIKKC